MLSQADNERLTRVGPGTPMGELLRRYWIPIAAISELDEDPVLPVRMLGENLVLYRDEQGTLGLVSQRCPHRGASMAYGIPEQVGLRCPYHGWLFDQGGQCIEQPAEPEDSTFKHRVRIPAYPVQEMGGLAFAYMGPEPAPLLPRFDLYVAPNSERRIRWADLPCNWLQIMENSLDPVHVEYLHQRYTNYVLGRLNPDYKPVPIGHHEKIAFDVFEWGIYKRRKLEGQSEESRDWTTGHPIIFPIMLRGQDVDGSGFQSFHVRLPIDDVTTRYFVYSARPLPEGAPAQESIPRTPIPVVDPSGDMSGQLLVDQVLNQDFMAWITQGEISDRTTERLGSSDQGVILFRKLLNQELAKIARGEDPRGVIRDEADNVMIEIEAEGVGQNYLARELSTNYKDTLVFTRDR